MKTITRTEEVGTTPTTIELEKRIYLSIEGSGAPSDSNFKTSMENLMKASNAVYSSELKESLITEGEWWTTGEKTMMEVPPGEWHWKMQILLNKKALQQWKSVEQNHPFIQLQIEKEGEFVAVLHEGPFENEKESLEKLFLFVENSATVICSNHRERYLTDPEITASEDLRTLLYYRIGNE